MTVKNQGGTALPGAALTLTGPNSFSATGTGGAGGTYTFTGVPAGAGYSVAAAYGAGNGTTSGISVTLRQHDVDHRDHPDRIDRDHGEELERHDVLGRRPSPSPAPAATRSQERPTAGGTYTFNNVPAGNGYSVTATYAAASATTSGISVTSGNTTLGRTITIPTGSIRRQRSRAARPTYSGRERHAPPGPDRSPLTGTTGAGRYLADITDVSRQATATPISAHLRRRYRPDFGPLGHSRSRDAATVHHPDLIDHRLPSRMRDDLSGRQPSTLTGPGLYFVDRQPPPPAASTPSPASPRVTATRFPPPSPAPPAARAA